MKCLWGRMEIVVGILKILSRYQGDEALKELQCCVSHLASGSRGKQVKKVVLTRLGVLSENLESFENLFHGFFDVSRWHIKAPGSSFRQLDGKWLRDASAPLRPVVTATSRRICFHTKKYRVIQKVTVKRKSWVGGTIPSQKKIGCGGCASHCFQVRA